MSSETLMPGAGIARRPMHLIIVADCSGSMAGERIQALNFAVADMLPHLAEWEAEQERADVMVRVLGFATEPFWHVQEPTPVARMRWKPLRAVDRGRTNLGAALRVVADELRPDKLERRALRPAIVLITDGRPTDRPEDLEAGFRAIQEVPAAKAALRLAVAIGRDARSEEATRFIGDPDVPVLLADKTDEIADRLIVASIAVSRLSEVGADRGMLAQQILGQQGAADYDGETIV